MSDMWGSIPSSAYFGNAGNNGGQVAGAGAATAYNPATGRTENVTRWNGGTPVFGGAGTSSMSPAQMIQNIIQNGTNAVPDSLKALGSMSTNTMTSTAGVSSKVQGAADKTADYVSNLVDQGIPDYTGQRVAGFSAPEQTSQDALMASMRAGGGPGAAAMSGATNQKTAPIAAAQLGDTDISKYMNPAQTAEYDAILHGNAVMNNATRARQAKSGAFGANSDVAQAENNESTQRQLGLASRDAFATAQAGAQGDVAAQNAAKASNQSAQLTDAQRALTGGSLMNSQALDLSNATAASGAASRGVAQAGNDAAWQQYLQKLGYGTQLASTASGALGALPGTKTLSQESPGPSAAGQEIGALIGLTGIQNQYSQPQGGGGSVSYSSGGGGSPAMSTAQLLQMLTQGATAKAA